MSAKANFDLLNTVELEVNSRCNRKCGYCPVSVLPIPPVARYMSDEVLIRTLEELQHIEFTGRISYHFYNEPLLRKDLDRVVAIVKDYLPSCYQVLFTNGDLLNDDNYHVLLQAGIDLFQVTSHSLKEHPERPSQVVNYPEQLTLTNRGGTLTHLPNVTEEILQKPCYAPSEMLIVTVPGDIVLCYEDAEREHVMGNIMEESLEDIWNGEKFVAYRQALADGDRRNGADICRSCTNTAHTERDTSHLPSV